jgi:hypothetical protein
VIKILIALSFTILRLVLKEIVLLESEYFTSSFEYNEFGLISINFNEKDIKEINTFIPFGNVKPLTYTPPSTPTPTPTVTPTPVTPTPTPTHLPPTPTPTPTPSKEAVKSLFVAF